MIRLEDFKLRDNQYIYIKGLYMGYRLIAANEIIGYVRLETGFDHGFVDNSRGIHGRFMCDELFLDLWKKMKGINGCSG